MALITPGIGLIFWMLVSFSLVLFILKRYAWKPILSSLKEREESIADALNEAEKAKKEMANLNADNERILNEARSARDGLLKEGKELKEKIIAEAKGKAQEEADKIVTAARENIVTEKLAAMAEIKNHVAVLSIDIAEKILKSELADADRQKQLVDNLLNDIRLN